MIGAAHTIVVHQHDSPLWRVLLALAITGGIAAIAFVIGIFFWILDREQRGRPVMPWSARMRVEKVKASRQIAEEHLKLDALEVKRLAVTHTRDRVVEAIKDGDNETVERLALPTAGSEVSDGDWRPK